MGDDLIGSELDDRKGLVVLHSILLVITCAHYARGLREVEGKENRIKRCCKNQLCAPCRVP